MIDVQEITCQRVLSPTGMRQAEYVVNPYRGCQFGCTYCYAQCSKFARKQNKAWGDYVDVKVNAFDVFEKELSANPSGRIMFGSVTEVYQPLEKKYELTRRLLGRLVGTDMSVLILTRSDLIVRDIDILKQLGDVLVCFTINTTDTTVIRAFEKRSPAFEQRRDAVRTLYEAGIPVYVHVGPCLPHLTDPQKIFAELAPYCYRFDIENLNLKMVPWTRLHELIRLSFTPLLESYETIYRNEGMFNDYWQGVRVTLNELGRVYDRDVRIHFHPYDTFFPVYVS